VTRGAFSDIGNESSGWKIPYHEPFKHAVPTFEKWSPPKPADDAKIAKVQTDKFLAELSEK
jgi:hypothetical protein